MEADFASRIALDGTRPDGGPQQNRVLTRSCPRYLNINYATDERFDKVRKANGDVYYVEPGTSTDPTRVQIRYISRGGNMVMTRFDAPGPEWTFMERDCFEDMPKTRPAWTNKPGNAN